MNTAVMPTVTRHRSAYWGGYRVGHQAPLISAVFKWAVSEGLLDKDPNQGIKRCFDEAPREHVVTDKEVRDFWDGIAAAPGSESAKIAMQSCFVLGQRPKEIAHRRTEDVIGKQTQGQARTLSSEPRRSTIFNPS